MIFALYLVKIVVSDEFGKHIGEFFSLPGGKTIPAKTGQGPSGDGLEIENFSGNFPHFIPLQILFGGVFILGIPQNINDLLDGRLEFVQRLSAMGQMGHWKNN